MAVLHGAAGGGRVEGWRDGGMEGWRDGGMDERCGGAAAGGGAGGLAADGRGEYGNGAGAAGGAAAIAATLHELMLGCTELQHAQKQQGDFLRDLARQVSGLRDDFGKAARPKARRGRVA